MVLLLSPEEYLKINAICLFFVAKREQKKQQQRSVNTNWLIHSIIHQKQKFQIILPLWAAIAHWVPPDCGESVEPR